MATNWLEAMDVSVAVLEGERPFKVEQVFQWKDGIENGPKESLPLFKVEWGMDQRYKSDPCLNLEVPRLRIEIDGRTKELISLRLDDDSISQRPAGFLKNKEELLKISDDEFLSYSDQQRKDLVARFAAITYDSPTGGTNSAGPRGQTIALPWPWF